MEKVKNLTILKNHILVSKNKYRRVKHLIAPPDSIPEGIKYYHNLAVTVCILFLYGRVY
jgi:hypothetical protein